MNAPDNYYCTLQTPLGILEIQASDKALLSVLFVDKAKREDKKNAITELAEHQLREYFAGKRQAFDLPLGAEGTAFQSQVWQQLLAVPFAQTCSYKDIASAIQNPKAVRAVGAANGKNPISIIVPCHRVIGASGTLTGYAGGLNRKAWLLEHESNVSKSKVL